MTQIGWWEPWTAMPCRRNASAGPERVANCEHALQRRDGVRLPRIQDDNNKTGIKNLVLLGF